MTTDYNLHIVVRHRTKAIKLSHEGSTKVTNEPDAHGKEGTKSLLLNLLHTEVRENTLHITI